MRFTFLCVNLWWGGQLWDTLIPFLRAESPDILVLQEVYDSPNLELAPQFRSLAALREELGYAHHHFAPAFRDVRPEGNIVNGNAVLSRFPIVAAATTFYDVPYTEERRGERGWVSLTPRNLQHVTIDARGTTLNVFNTQGIWDTHGGDNERRMHMGEIIAAAVAGKPHVILAGDFNVQEGTKTIRTIEAELVNVFQGELKTTFNLRHKREPGFATAVVDMVFVSRDIRVLVHRAPSVDVSDHVPLVCEFAV